MADNPTILLTAGITAIVILSVFGAVGTAVSVFAVPHEILVLLICHCFLLLPVLPLGQHCMLDVLPVIDLTNEAARLQDLFHCLTPGLAYKHVNRFAAVQ